MFHCVVIVSVPGSVDTLPNASCKSPLVMLLFCGLHKKSFYCSSCLLRYTVVRPLVQVAHPYLPVQPLDPPRAASRPYFYVITPREWASYEPAPGPHFL